MVQNKAMSAMVSASVELLPVVSASAESPPDRKDLFPGETDRLRAPQSDLLKKEIYLFERLDMPKRANMQNVTAIVFVRKIGK